VLLLREQQAAGFPDVAGTQVSATFPVSDRLITRVALARLPPSAPVRDLDIRAHAGGRLSARVRLARPAFLPPFTVPITIVRQAELPDVPVIVLHVGSPGGLLKLAGPLVRLVDALPPGFTLERDLLAINLRTVLSAADAVFALDFLEHLDIGTAEGLIVLSVRARVPGRGPRGPDPRSAEL
jgi:hypothetical protein